VVEHVRHRHEALAAVRVQLERARRDERRRLAERQVPRGALRVRRFFFFFFFFFFGGFFFVYTLGVPASIEHLRRHSAVREERAQALRVLAADGDDPRVVLAHRRFVLADAPVRVGAGEASLESVLVPRERQRLASAREDGEVRRPRRGGAEGALVHHRQDQRGVVEVVEGSAREDGGDGRVPGGDAPRPRDLAQDVADAHGAVRGEDRAVRAVGAGRGDVARDERGVQRDPAGGAPVEEGGEGGVRARGRGGPGGRGVGVGVGGGGGVVVRIRRRASATSPAIAGGGARLALGGHRRSRARGRVHEVSETSPGGACARRVHRTARGRREGSDSPSNEKISGGGDDRPPAGARREAHACRPVGCQLSASAWHPPRAHLGALARFE
jgi:hypothetical protein